MKYFFSLLLLLLGLSPWCACRVSGSVLNPASRNSLYKYRNKPQLSRAGGEERYVPALLQFDSSDALESLERKGVRVLYHRSDIALCYVPMSVVDEIEGIDGILAVSLSEQSIGPAMNQARPFSGVDRAHSYVLPPSGAVCNGSGVVTGLCDIGFDPAHIAFRGRVGFMSHYNDTIATVVKMTAPEEISAWVTDNPDENHACHVANIMAGTRGDWPYYGVAPGADLAVSTSRLEDVGILAGVEDIIAYAREKNLPAVVNLSIGSNNGPHDGSDLFCRYLDECAREVPVVISAGNNANSNIAAIHYFTEDAPQMRLQIQNMIDWAGINMYGRSDFWTDDSSTPMRFRVEFYDDVERKTVYVSEWITVDENDRSLLIDSDDDAEAAKYFTGQLMVSTGIDAANGRRCAVADYDMVVTERFNENRWARYCIDLVAEAPAGSRITAHADGQLSFFRPVYTPGYTLPGSDLSISNIACGHNTIVVGSCTTANSFELINGNTEVFSQYPVGMASSYTSYGTLLDGRSLPDIAAPGTMIVSAMSGPFMEKHEGFTSMIVPPLIVDGEMSWWAINGGTSMSAPHVAGIFALWLQANPDLTPQELLEMACKTARRDFSDIDDPRWGAGEIDAAAGLDMILSGAGINNPELQSAPLFRIEGRRIIPLSEDIAVHDMYGRRAPADADLQPGIYVVSNSRVACKVAIR